MNYSNENELECGKFNQNDRRSHVSTEVIKEMRDQHLAKSTALRCTVVRPFAPSLGPASKSNELLMPPSTKSRP